MFEKQVSMNNTRRKKHAMTQIQLFIVDDQLVLTHHGVKGMKWGIRKSRAKSGMSRAMSAQHEKNRGSLTLATKALGKRTKGEGLTVKTRRVQFKAQRLLLGKKAANRINNIQITALQQQNKRIEQGKTTMLDKLQVGLTTSIPEMIVTADKQRY